MSERRAEVEGEGKEHKEDSEGSWCKSALAEIPDYGAQEQKTEDDEAPFGEGGDGLFLLDDNISHFCRRASNFVWIVTFGNIKWALRES